MKVLSLCFFSLLVLAVSVQAQDAVNLPGIDAKLDETANRISSLVVNTLNQRKSQLLNRLSEHASSLKNSPDRCAVSRASKIEKLRQELKAAPDCIAIQNFTEDIKNILGGAVGGVVDAVHSALDILKQLTTCITSNPLQAVAPLQCFVQATGLTVHDGVKIVTNTVTLGIKTVGAFTKLGQGVLQCLHVQQAVESKFHDILQTSC